MLRPDWEQKLQKQRGKRCKAEQGSAKEHDENLVFNTTSVSK
jgi:hypothetical protein